ncbi:MAG: RNA polymerase sporulation sigma factor SigE, partial [Firmicutes bacterium]|nr:RNA polymerase sporulation sigma factor SigE [Bacillota bacterium]
MLNIFKRLKKKLRETFSAHGLDPNLLYYICGSEALKRPLESEEEKEVLWLCSQGDTDAKGKLIEHNLRLVVYIAKKFENTGVEIEDLISVGTIGLIKAVNSFKIDKNIKLA